ncbi:MAG: hypothetical protein EA412_04275 [Chitinophagaceae bacterium]|nr:MAG: hypothetical protein EA412_04275 [Chitinophagaceae bacterium]
MKILVPIIVCLLMLTATTASAQGAYLIRETTYMHNDKQRPAIVVTVDPDVREITSEWASYWRSEYRVRLRGRRGSQSAENVSIEALNNRNFDLYTETKREDGKTRMYVFAAFGYDIYFGDSQYQNEFDWLKKQLDNFLSGYLSSYYRDLIRSNERDLKRVERDLSRLVSNTERAERNFNKNKSDIEKLQKENKALEEQIKQGRSEITTLEQQVNTQQNALSEMERKKESIKK